MRLEKDISETDKYGRLLRMFIYLPDKAGVGDSFINKYLVAEGFAKVSLSAWTLNIRKYFVPLRSPRVKVKRVCGEDVFQVICSLF